MYVIVDRHTVNAVTLYLVQSSQKRLAENLRPKTMVAPACKATAVVTITILMDE